MRPPDQKRQGGFNRENYFLKSPGPEGNTRRTLRAAADAGSDVLPVLRKALENIRQESQANAEGSREKGTGTLQILTFFGPIVE